MSDLTDKLASIPPLGKSAEEVEADNANQINPPSDDTVRVSGDATVVAPVPIVNPGAQGIPGTIASNGAPIIGTYSVGGALHDDVNEGRRNDDSTDNSQS